MSHKAARVVFKKNGSRQWKFFTRVSSFSHVDDVHIQSHEKLKNHSILRILWELFKNLQFMHFTELSWANEMSIERISFSRG